MQLPSNDSFTQSCRRLILGLICLSPAWCLGALTWDAQEIEVKAKPGDEQAVAIFHFVNSGDTTVTITSVQPGCGCTTTELAKQTYAPGEAGEIKAVFTFGDRVGPQEKMIQVVVDNALNQPTSLVLKVNIPELITYSPHLLLWRTAEEIADKSVIITNTGPEKITSINFTATPPTEATIRIEPIETESKYRITIRPVSNAKIENLPLPFIANFANGSTYHFTVFVLVK